MLEKEYEFFESKREELLKEHEGQFVVIKGQKILAFYDSLVEAVEETQKQHKLGTFAVQKVEEKEKSVRRFRSRVAFP